MIRLTKLSNQYKRRTLRALYAQTQAYPYGMSLYATFDRTLGQLSGAGAVTGSKAAINPGAVMTMAPIVSGANAEEVTLLANVTGGVSDANATARAIGLSGNFVGGDLDELGDRAEIGVWRGRGGVFEVLAPAFDDTSLSTDQAAIDGLGATEVYMRASNTTGRLVQINPAANLGPEGATNRAVVRLMNRLSANAIVVELLV